MDDFRAVKFFLFSVGKRIQELHMQRANEVFDVLVCHAGVEPDRRDAFISHFTDALKEGFVIDGLLGLGTKCFYRQGQWYLNPPALSITDQAKFKRLAEINTSLKLLQPDTKKAA